MSGKAEDYEAIRQVVAAYAHAIDRCRWDMMAKVFHEDADYGFGPVGGSWRDFVPQAQAIIEPCLATQHHLGQSLIRFDGADAADTETYFSAMHTIPAGYPVTDVFPDKGKIYSAVIAGRYVDRFEKRDGEWRIAKRTGLYDWREFREVEGVDLSELPKGAGGYRDDRDPSAAVAQDWRG